MGELSENKPKIEVPRLTQKNSLRKIIAHGGLAIGTTLASLFASPPQEVQAQKDPLVQTINNEQTPEFFNKKITEILERDQIVTVAQGTYRISPEAEKLDHFLGLPSLGDDLKDPPFVGSVENQAKAQEMMEVVNPIKIGINGTEYLLINSHQKDGSRKIFAVALKQNNWGAISRLDSDSIAIFSKTNPDIFDTTKMKSAGEAPDNINHDNESEFHCRDLNNNLFTVMREKPKTQSLK